MGDCEHRDQTLFGSFTQVDMPLTEDAYLRGASSKRVQRIEALELELLDLRRLADTMRGFKLKTGEVYVRYNLILQEIEMLKGKAKQCSLADA